MFLFIYEMFLKCETEGAVDRFKFFHLYDFFFTFSFSPAFFYFRFVQAADIKSLFMRLT